LACIHGLDVKVSYLKKIEQGKLFSSHLEQVRKDKKLIYIWKKKAKMMVSKLDLQVAYCFAKSKIDQTLVDVSFYN